MLKLPITKHEAENEITNAVYAATQIFEQLENRGLLLGNGHHARQKIAETARLELSNRWRDPVAPTGEHRPYEKEHFEQFCREVEAAGYTVKHYRGRWFYEGPAVSVESDEFQKMVRATTVELQKDELGKTGIIVYPTIDDHKEKEL